MKNRVFFFSFYDNKWDTSTKTIEKHWSEMIDLFRNHSVRGSPKDTNSTEKLEKHKDGPAIIFASVGERRAKRNVITTHALALDFDSLTENELLDALKQLDRYEYLIYTTHKHGSQVAGGRPRVRVVLPLDEPIPAERHTPAWEGLNNLVGGGADPATKDASRLNYLPSTFDPSLAWFFHHPGKWIAEADLTTVSSPLQGDAGALVEILRHIPKKHELKEVSKKLLAGERLAEPDHRHAQILALTMYLACRAPNSTRGALDALFGPSIAVMRGKTLDEVWTAYEGAVVRIKERAIEIQTGGEPSYTDDELQAIATAQGCTVEELERRWIVQAGGGGWILGPEGNYYGPFEYRDWQQALWQHLRRSPVQLVEVTEKGTKYVPAVDLVRKNGSLASGVLADLTIQRSTYDPERLVMREAVCRVRPELVPRYDPEIDRWLRLFFGKQYNKGIDWMSVFPDLSKLLCALYFDGPKASGKTMFVHGLAKVWTEGAPSKLGRVLGNFNDVLIDCPLIVADEKLPRSSQWDTITEDLREMVSVTSRELSRKYRATAKLIGAIRLVLAANNEFLLDSARTYSRADQEAIAQRFCYVKIGDKSADYLYSVPKAKRQAWVERGIAEHTLWLAENHVVKHPGDRFEVEGGDSLMSRIMITTGFWNSQFAEFCVRYLMHPKPLDMTGQKLVMVKDGQLLVNVQGVLDGWETYMPKSNLRLETSRVAGAVRAYSIPGERVQKRTGDGKRPRYYVIDVSLLEAWSEANGIGNMETIYETLEGKKQDEENVVVPIEDARKKY